MNLLSSCFDLLQRAYATIWNTLIDSTLRGIPVLLLAGLAIFLMRRCSAATRHQLLLSLMIGLLLLPAAGNVLPGVSLPLGAVNIEQVQAVAEALSPQQARPEAQADPSGSSGVSGVNAHKVSFSLDWRAVAGALWLLVSTGILLRLAIGHFRAWRLISRSSRPSRTTAAIWHDELTRLVDESALCDRPELLLSDEIESPAVYWSLRSVLVLPASALDWPIDRIRPTLLHETAHLERGDLWKRALAQVACALYWPNPLVWLAAGKMYAAAELACDDRVLARGVRSSTYARLLLETSQNACVAKFRPVALTAPIATMASGLDFKDRILSLLDPAVGRGPLGRKSFVLTLLLAVVLVTPLVVLQPQDLSLASIDAPSDDPLSPPQAADYQGPHIVPGLSDVFLDAGDDLDRARRHFLERGDNVLVKGAGYLAYRRHEDRLMHLIDTIERDMRRSESVETANDFISEVVEIHAEVGVTTLRWMADTPAREELKDSILMMYTEMIEVAQRHLDNTLQSDESPEVKSAARAVFTDMENWLRWAHRVTAAA